jgi:hypothetical protein
MVMKINGIDSKIMPPAAYDRPYVFAPFAETTSGEVGGKFRDKKQSAAAAMDVKQAINKVWLGVVNRSTKPKCNDYFKSLPGKKSLSELLVDRDFMIYQLIPRQGEDKKVLPYACAIGHDIGIDPAMLFNDNPEELICTLIHELAHAGGALTDKKSYDMNLPLAAEKALPCCGCIKYYHEGMLGMINVRSASKLA